MPTTTPNIVILYADDLGWGDLGCFGAKDIPTPHLDSLCADGVKLSQWYSNSPVCSPSRASLLTGRYPGHAGVETILGGRRTTPGLPHQPTIASHLKERGYRTGLFGKWHLGADPSFAPGAFGFDEVFGFRAGCVDYYSHIFYWGAGTPLHDLWEDEEEVWRNGEYLTTLLGERAARFISAEEGGTPFFCFVPFNAPHYPLHAPAEHMERVAHLPEDRRPLAAVIAAMDDAVGAILSALDEAGVREDTLVLFSSDNGPSRESRNWLDGEEMSYTGGSAGGLRGSKGSVLEGGIREPSIISWPARLPAGGEYADLGMMMDVLPTILHAVDGAPAALEEVDGVSLLEQIGGSAPADPDRPVFWTYNGQWAVRRGRHKLVIGAHEGMDPPASVERALFDLGTDIGETTDVSAEHPEILALLEADLAGFRAQRDGWLAAQPAL